MAALARNRYYQWYLREVEAGQLELPEYDENEKGEIILYYGEVFCRVEDCDKANKRFSATNNLRTHLEKHISIDVVSGEKGGRASQKVIDEAVAWYKGLFAGAESTMDLSSARPSPSPGPAGSPRLPPLVSPYVTPKTRSPLPLKKDGTPHLLNMRRRAESLGGSVPCSSCESKFDCCKDINKCDNFLLFDCGALTPQAASKPFKVLKTT
ncbi:hypothetical protein BDV23DRAFT_185621 [Aspergillus alliaceus]|uniref:Uncharacterized protein n=1 Tax=Petromyces alliaceus TaxID=209559 RepID=A0A5N7C2E5_PETAA|nr:hypothetical protein BDV23DRAFT_185621 [Aspergillus alliaceus]